MLAAITQFLIVLSMVPIILKGKIIKYTFFTMLPCVDIGFTIDAFGLIFAITSSFLWILVSSYSIGYMRSLNEHAQTRYYFCFAIAIFGAIGVAMSGNLFTLFFFWEIMAWASLFLIWYRKTKSAQGAGFRYIMVHSVGGVCLLAGIVLHLQNGGSLVFESFK